MLFRHMLSSFLPSSAATTNYEPRQVAWAQFCLHLHHCTHWPPLLSPNKHQELIWARFHCPPLLPPTMSLCLHHHIHQSPFLSPNKHQELVWACFLLFSVVFAVLHCYHRLWAFIFTITHIFEPKQTSRACLDSFLLSSQTPLLLPLNTSPDRLHKLVCA